VEFNAPHDTVYVCESSIGYTLEVYRVQYKLCLLTHSVSTRRCPAYLYASLFTQLPVPLTIYVPPSTAPIPISILRTRIKHAERAISAPILELDLFLRIYDFSPTLLLLSVNFKLSFPLSLLICNYFVESCNTLLHCIIYYCN